MSTTAARPLARALSSLLLTALLGLLVLGGAAGPAGAATGVRAAEAEGSLCSDDQGVSVVVDPGSLGGAVQQDCVEDGGGKLATEVFQDAGHELTPVGEFPGAACQVDGEPADAACQSMPPADAYWGLYLATGDTWDYAPKGADELQLEDGAFVAFSWQDSAESTVPSVEPVAPEASESASPSGSQSDGASVESSDSGDGTGESAVQSNDGDDLSIYIPIAVLVLLAGAVGFLMLRRRTHAGE